MLTLPILDKWLENAQDMSINHRRLSLGIAASLMLEVINKIAPLLILHHAQKSLGLADFGWAQLQLALFETLQPLVAFGMSNYALAEISRQGDEQPIIQKLFTHIFLLKILNAVIVSAIYLISLAYKGTPFDTYTFAVLIVVMLATIFDGYWICIVQHKFANVSLFTGILRILSLIAILTIVSSPSEKGVFVLLCLLPNALMAFGTGLYAYRDLAFSKIDRLLLSKILIRSIPFALLVLMLAVFDRMDIFLVEKWFGMEQAGAYAGPAKVIQSLSMIIASLALPFYAEILKVNDSESLTKHMALSLWCLSALIAPIIFGMPFIDKEVIGILFTNMPDSIDHLMSLLSLGMIGTLFLSVCGLQVLMAKARPWPIIKAGLAFIVLVPTFVFLLKDTFGFRSAAFAVIAGKWIVGLICMHASRDFISKMPWGAFVKPMLAGGGMALILMLLKLDSIVSNIIAGAVAYMICLIISNFGEVREFAKHPKFAKIWKRRL